MKRIFIIFSISLLTCTIALAQLSKKDEIAQRHTVHELTNRIRLHYSQGLYDQVIRECKQLDTLEPGNPIASYYQTMAMDKKKAEQVSEKFAIAPLVTPVASPEPTMVVPTPQLTPTVSTMITPEPSSKKLSPAQHYVLISIPIIALLIGILIFIVSRKKRKPLIKAKPVERELAITREQVMEELPTARAEAYESEAEPARPAVSKADLTPLATELPETFAEPSATVQREKKTEVPEPTLEKPEPERKPTEPLFKEVEEEEERLTPLTPAEEEVSPTITSQLDELLSADKPEKTTKEAGEDYEKIMLDPTSGEETVISPSIGAEETIVDRKEKTDLGGGEAWDEEKTLILSPRKGPDEILDVRVKKKPEEKEEITSEITEADKEDKSIGPEKPGPLGVAEGETLLPGERAGLEQEGKKITEEVSGEVRQQRQEQLFDDQYTKACQAIEEKDWAKALHYLTIAAALKPESQEVKEKLKLVRTKKKEIG